MLYYETMDKMSSKEVKHHMIWEQIETGPTETFKMKVKNGYIYRVDHYEEHHEDGRSWWKLVTSSMVFTPNE